MKQKKEEEFRDNPATKALETSVGQSPYTDLDGNPVVLSDYVGQVLIVNSWASWSPFSTTELPLLSELANQYKDKGVKILAINRAEPAMTAERFLNSVVSTEDVMLVLDPDDRYYESIAGFGMPETVFYDRTGSIVHHARGVMTLEEMTKYVESARETKTE